MSIADFSKRRVSLASKPSGVLPEWVLLGVSLFWLAVAHRPFFAAALTGRDLQAPATWGWVAALSVALLALNFLLLALFCHRRTLKPTVSVLLVLAAGAVHFMQTYGVYLNASMLSNALNTNVGEARELIGGSFLRDLLLLAVLPMAALWWVPLRQRVWTRALWQRLVWIFGALAVLVGTVLWVYQPMASFMRNQRDARFLITPLNLLWSTGTVVAGEIKGAGKPREPQGVDAKPGPLMGARTRPTLLVMVVGETARAANWGLSGYARQTTPELAARPDVINFPDVSACGTNTETSVPCMFAPVGRRDYDEGRIRGRDSLLHVLNRAGVGVTWRDNQSGCKQVCADLPAENVPDLKPPADLCEGDHCLDEALLTGLDERLGQIQGTQVLVLHQLGNHGPSYFRRYPKAFERFTPACGQDDLQKCKPEEIVNAYDNALLYTDHVLSSLIGKLKARADTVDSAVLYVSDHGESLGEGGLFLHGMPYAIAPKEQKQVPMVMWFSAGMLKAQGLDEACVRQRATQPAAHDHLFHTLTGLADVQTTLYESQWDLLRDCRRTP